MRPIQMPKRIIRTAEHIRRRRLDADLDHFEPIGKDVSQGLVNDAEVTHILECRPLRKETVSVCVKRCLKAQAVASEAIVVDVGEELRRRPRIANSKPARFKHADLGRNIHPMLWIMDLLLLHKVKYAPLMDIALAG